VTFVLSRRYLLAMATGEKSIAVSRTIADSARIMYNFDWSKLAYCQLMYSVVARQLCYRAFTHFEAQCHKVQALCARMSVQNPVSHTVTFGSVRCRGKDPYA
jgi:hypothetical protein